MQQICPEMLPAETQELVKVTPNDNFLALIYSVLCDHKNLRPYGDTAEHVNIIKLNHATLKIWMHQELNLITYIDSALVMKLSGCIHGGHWTIAILTRLTVWDT